MRQSVWLRGVLLVGLLGALLGLAVWHGSLAPDPALGAYPGAEQVGTDYDRYVGEQVSVWGLVVDTNPVVIEMGYGVKQAMRLRLIGLDPSVAVTEGDRLVVFGLLQPDRTVRVLNAVPVAGWGVPYTYTVSFLAGLWVLGRIVQYWRVDAGAWVLRRRSAPPSIGRWLRDRLRAVFSDA